jgi:hypothetical protein
VVIFKHIGAFLGYASGFLDNKRKSVGAWYVCEMMYALWITM